MTINHSPTVRANSREHVEHWLEFERLVDELIETGQLVGTMVYSQELIDEHDLPQDVLGKTVEEVGLPPVLVDDTLERLSIVQEKLNTVAVPSPEAIRDYLLNKINDRVEELNKRVARMDERT